MNAAAVIGLVFGVGIIAYFLFVEGVSLGNLSATQILQYAQNAGFTGDDAITATAIALAESGGNPSAYNPETAAAGGTPQGMGSYGLWQIYLKAHPEFQGQSLNDPQTNANAAYQVFQEQGWAAWSTYTGGQYQAFIGQVQAAQTA